MKTCMIVVSAALLSGCVVSVQSGPSNNKPPNQPKPAGPVKLGLFRPEPEPGMGTGGIDWERMNTAWRGHFGGYDLAPQDKCDKAQKDEAKGKFNAFTLGVDAVRVKVDVGTVKKRGLDSKGRSVEMILLKFTATITWPDGQTRTAYVDGNVFQNEALLKDLATKVRAELR